MMYVWPSVVFDAPSWGLLETECADALSALRGNADLCGMEIALCRKDGVASISGIGHYLSAETGAPCSLDALSRAQAIALLKMQRATGGISQALSSIKDPVARPGDSSWIHVMLTPQALLLHCHSARKISTGGWPLLFAEEAKMTVDDLKSAAQAGLKLRASGAVCTFVLPDETGRLSGHSALARAAALGDLADRHIERLNAFLIERHKLRLHPAWIAVVAELLAG